MFPIKFNEVAITVAISILMLVSCPFETTAQDLHPAHERKSQESIQFYLKQVGPILKAKCYRCHGPERNISPRIDESDWPLEFVALDTAPQLSTLWRIHLFPPPDQSQEKMPPQKAKDPLSTTDEEVLKLWIRKGAPYSPDFDWYQINENFNSPPNRILAKITFRVSLLGMIISSSIGLIYRKKPLLRVWVYRCIAAFALIALGAHLLSNVI